MILATPSAEADPDLPQVASPFNTSITIEAGDYTAEGHRVWRRVTECPLAATGSWDHWRSVKGCAPSGLVGVVDDLRFVFSCGPSRNETPCAEPGELGIATWAWWRFTPKPGRNTRATPPSQTAVSVALSSRGAQGRYLAFRGNARDGGRLQADAVSRADEGAMLRLVDNEDGSWSLRCTLRGIEMVACAARDGALVAIVRREEAHTALCTKWRLQGTT